MSPAWRGILATCSIVILLQSTVLWWQTGRAGLTRYYDPERAAHERRAAAIDSVLDDPASAPTAPLGPPNSFALGFLPFGFGRHLISLITLSLPAIIVLTAASRGVRYPDVGRGGTAPSPPP